MSRYQRQLRGTNQSNGKAQSSVVRAQGRKESLEKTQLRLEGDEIDSKFGFDRMKEGATRLGWLLNYLPITMPDDSGIERSGLDLYFLDRAGGNFKASIFHQPFFYLDVSDPRRILEISQHLLRRFEGCVVEEIEKEDLDLANHLSGKRHKFIKIAFNTVNDLVECRQQLRPTILRNKKRESADDTYETNLANDDVDTALAGSSDPLAYLIDMREYDIPYTMRVAIDRDLRVGAWYEVTPESGSDSCNVVWLKDMLELCDLRILAFDIECEKSPLKFPDASRDRVFMISYMIAGQGYLIINREIVSEDIEDFEYTPLPKLPGPFKVFNEPNEEASLSRFIRHIQELRPHVFVSYNGDFFDWPFLEKRCDSVAGLSLYRELGVRASSGGGGGGSDGEYTGRCIVHLDAFCWVQRDSYLPQGNQNLKAVTRYKLGYDPIEVDPEDMVRFARERPTHMASYSVSDAVATYYLYTTYVHNFIFSLSTIIPMGPEDVLRKGSGTLCEALLVVEANRGNIICPNKHEDPLESFHNGHLIQSETYIGGHVECLEAGVFRADIPAKFTLIPSALQQLIDNVDRDLTFALETEHDIQRSDIANYDEIRQYIVERLEMLRDSPHREEYPVIYHLDVGAMYPNIILTNRLQPSAMVSQHDCAACDFNRAENNCKRPMVWTWRGDFFPASQAEYQSVKRQLTHEKSGFSELTERQQADMIKDRLKSYSNRVYKKVKQTAIVDKVHTVCMRENAFYVNTVRAFRDRRYDYKLLTKQWKGKKSEADKRGDAIARKAAEDKEVLMDSLQLAHKCILNSFYGYVMRKGARWRSMEMAGIVTKTGAELIKQARELVEQVGRPLELDTDGIWCILPASFPQDVKFKTKSGSKVSVGYPCAMLNADVHDRYTNHQYQDLAAVAGTNSSTGPSAKYESHSECSIYFELDGPYKAMILPASPEEGKLLKKKYVVFNFDGTIAELKGFEIKRRGELEIVKAFQSQVFEQFLSGGSLVDCYQAVGNVANQWLDVLDSHGSNLDDEELLHLISERKTISKTLDDYEGRKATSLTSASRLADFLGAEMVKDKGLNCNLIISKYPSGAPVAERAIPVAIFSAEQATKRFYLRKWIKDPSFDCSDFRDVVDWEYYKGRLGGTIQKIITIPAGMQGVANPVPRVEHPVWLQRRFNESQGLKQMKLTAMFASMKSIAASKTINALPGPKVISASSPHKAVGPQSEDVSGIMDLVAAGTSKLLSPAGKKSRVGADTPPDTNQRKRNLFGTPDVSERGGSQGILADIEDIGGGSSNRAGFRPVVHYRASPEAARLQATEGMIDFNSESKSPAKVVDSGGTARKVLACSELQTDEDFKSWLAARKASWKQKRQSRKQLLVARSGNRKGEHVQEDSDPSGSRKKPVSVADFVRNATLQATQGFWQILELQELDTPGEFIIWAMTSRSQLQRFRITVPRTMYINCNGVEAEKIARSWGGVKVRRDLPHGRPCLSLYEVSISERNYQRNEKNLSLFLCDPQVEGAYETQTPLSFRAILQTGCVARLNDTVANEAKTSNSFRLRDLEFVNVLAHPYLESNSATFRRIFIYCAVDKKNMRTGFGGVGLFIIDGNNGDMDLDPDGEKLSAKCYFWLANGGFSLDSKPPLQRIFRKHQPDERAQVKFSTKFTSTVAEALRMCNDALGVYLREKHGPTLVVAQGGFPAKQWRRNMPTLSEFPLTLVPAHSQDDLFPALGWQQFIAERMIHRFLVFPRWLRDRLQCARHAHVPICNLGADALTTMIDVNIARQLQHNRHLLWASDGLHPDIGGAEADENFMWSDALKEPVVNVPGAYRSICVEMELYGLAICSILGSGILDAEGLTSLSVSALDSSGTSTEDGGEAAVSSFPLGTSSAAQTVSTDSSCARAFMLLKAVVTKWLDDAKIRGDPISESMLMALYRYLCGYGDALLQDPSLHRIVYNLMSKLFKRLIGQLKKLGVRVIHATFSRVIIHTNKRDVPAAQEYVDYIISTIVTHELFTHMEITPKSYWEQLIWMGPENWGGIAVQDNSDDNEIDLIDEDGGDDGDADVNDEHDTDVAVIDAAVNPAASANTVKPWFSKITKPENKSAEYDFLDHLLSPKKPKPDRSKDKRHKGVDGDDYEEDSDDEVSDDDNGRRHRDLYEDVIPTNNDIVDGQSSISPSCVHMDPNSLLQSNWNLASYLPDAVSAYFHELIGEYLLQFRKRRLKLCQQRDEILSLSTQYTQPSKPVPMDDDSIDEAVNTMMKNLVKKKLTTQMLQVVDNLAEVFSHNYDRKEREDNTVDTANLFPQQAGSHLTLSSPALEFVKATTHVMALDGTLAEEVLAMKRLLLTQLRVKEFSLESQFADPCLSYLLRDVICGFCSTCRDIDLLRDPVVANPRIAREERWICSHCGNSLVTEQIENRLLDEVGRRCSAFLLQDFRCSRTHLVSTRLFATSSDLSMPLTMDIAPKNISEELDVMQRVAKFHEFPYLLSMVEELMVQFERL